MKINTILLTLVFALLSVGCDGASSNTDRDAGVSDLYAESPAESPVDEPGDVVFGDTFPEVLAAEATPSDDGDWTFSVTLSSPYDTPQRYADAWRVVDDQGAELGIRVLGHDHASEQPFTRSGSVQIPDGLGVVYVEGRDQLNGWSGQRFEVSLPSP